VPLLAASVPRRAARSIPLVLPFAYGFGCLAPWPAGVRHDPGIGMVLMGTWLGATLALCVYIARAPWHPVSPDPLLPK
jgi:hypothetical protein